MRTSSAEGTSRANGFPRLAVQGCHIKHCPVQVGCIPCSKRLVRDGMELLVVPDVGHLGRDGEVPPQQPRHARIHQGMGLIVDEQECCVCHVLPNRRNAFESFAVTWPLTSTGDHLLCQSQQRRGSSTPQPYGSQGRPELVQIARGNCVPAWKALQETGQEGTDNLGAGALQQYFNNQQQVWICAGLPPRESPAIRREPPEQSAAEGWHASSRAMSTWSFRRSHVRMPRGRGPWRS